MKLQVVPAVCRHPEGEDAGVLCLHDGRLEPAPILEEDAGRDEGDDVRRDSGRISVNPALQRGQLDDIELRGIQRATVTSRAGVTPCVIASINVTSINVAAAIRELSKDKSVGWRARRTTRDLAGADANSQEQRDSTRSSQNTPRNSRRQSPRRGEIGDPRHSRQPLCAPPRLAQEASSQRNRAPESSQPSLEFSGIYVRRTKKQKQVVAN